MCRVIGKDDSIAAFLADHQSRIQALCEPDIEYVTRRTGLELDNAGDGFIVALGGNEIEIGISFGATLQRHRPGGPVNYPCTLRYVAVAAHAGIGE